MTTEHKPQSRPQCEAESSRFQYAARGSKRYSRCKHPASYRLVIATPAVADSDRTRTVVMCGIHAKYERDAGLVEHEGRL